MTPEKFKKFVGEGEVNFALSMMLGGMSKQQVREALNAQLRRFNGTVQLYVNAGRLVYHGDDYAPKTSDDKGAQALLLQRRKLVQLIASLPKE